MLSVHDETRTSPKFLSASFQVFLRENERFVGANENYDEHQGTEDDEAVFQYWGHVGGEWGGQVDPAVNVGGQVVDTLWGEEMG